MPIRRGMTNRNEKTLRTFDAISAIIPAFNEAGNIGSLVGRCRGFVDEVLVVDDGSRDATARIALEAGARVITQANAGYLAGIRNGFRNATGDIFVTLDADGEHQPEEIPKLLAPILAGEADMVLGRRTEIARISERMISAFTRLKVPIVDTGTGFRAFRRELALKLKMPGRCVCGTSVIEAHRLGARIVEVPISLRASSRPRRVAWHHFWQFGHVLKMMVEYRVK
jgi:polyprenyl-phospho-N-acetylgalactosaminyl synthase